MSKSAPPLAGEVFTIPYPFVTGTFTDYDGTETPSWKPGVRYEAISPEDSGSLCDALGTATFTVVDSFKPGRYPVRVFYTRLFTDPEGKTFGKTRLHIATVEKFRRLTRGYQHPFGIGEPYDDRWTRKTMDQFLAELREYGEQSA